MIQKYETRKCAVCFKPFLAVNKNAGPRRIGFSGIRGRNTICCSKKCSRDWKNDKYNREHRRGENE